MKRLHAMKGRAFILMLAAAMPAAALLSPDTAMAQQFSDSYTFLKAVKDKDGAKATQLIDEPGTTIIDTRDRSTGESALHLVVKRRDMTWLGFLLGKGARPDIKDNDGNTPLMIATTLRFVEGARLLVDLKANVNLANGSGETPLIRAVQLGDVQMVSMLVAAGANPDQRDLLAGMSARDYAARDQRSTSIMRELENAKPKTSRPTQGPRL